MMGKKIVSYSIRTTELSSIFSLMLLLFLNYKIDPLVHTVQRRRGNPTEKQGRKGYNSMGLTVAMQF